MFCIFQIAIILSCTKLNEFSFYNALGLSIEQNEAEKEDDKLISSAQSGTHKEWYPNHSQIYHSKLA